MAKGRKPRTWWLTLDIWGTAIEPFKLKRDAIAALKEKGRYEYEICGRYRVVKVVESKK
jgi:hypothetical protein